LAKIAAAAGVSPETVQGHGPKAALLMSAIELVALGVTGKESIFDLDVGRAFLAIDDLDEAIDFIVAAQTDVHERSARLVVALIGAAASDSELDRYLGDSLAGLRTQFRRVLSVSGDRGWLRKDVALDELVETTVIVVSFDAYLRITDRDGWSVAAYRAWCRRMLAETVFRRPAAKQRPRRR
jgi:AcrR family transcriptional regulator